MDAVLKHRIYLEEYIVVSTAISIFLQQKIAHVGVDIFLGYPLLIINVLLMLAVGRLVIHRYHLIFIGVVVLQSLVAAHFSATPIKAIISQIAGLGVISVYYFSVLLTSELTVPRWMELYAKFAFAVAVVGIVKFFFKHYLLHDAPRLTALYSEPSFYIYLTLPAVGYYTNRYLRHREYGLELLVFLLTYALADSTLGYLGLFLIAFFAAWPRLNFWSLLASAIGAVGAIAALYFVSGNFRLRAHDTVSAIATADLAHTNASTFAFLSNVYVTWRAFIDHPLIGVGMGGYQYAYTSYISVFSGIDPTIFALDLNKYDASSLFLRTTAEMGAIGITFLLGFLITCARVQGNVHRDIRNALLPFLIVRMSRYGSYFSLELYFFIGLYLFNYLESRSGRGFDTQYKIKGAI